MRATVTTTIESAPAHFKARAHASAVAPEVYTSSSRRIAGGTLRPRGTRKAPSTFSCRRIPGRRAWGTRSRVLESASGSNGRPMRRERREAISAGRLNPRRKYFQGWAGTGTTVGGAPSGNQVPPSPREGLVEAQGHGVDRVGATRVFRRDDRGANIPRVGEEGARGVERGRGGGAEAAGGRMRPGSGTIECAAPGAHSFGVGGPPGDGGGRKIGRCGRQEVPERREFTDPWRRREARPLATAARLRGDGRRFSGRWRRRRTPGCRGRWRTRSMSRRRGTGRST